jgi:hypothetical protein
MTDGSAEKYRQAHDEMCQDETILGSGRSDPFLSLSIPDVPPRHHELIDYCKHSYRFIASPDAKPKKPARLPNTAIPALSMANCCC